jgi:hypothetical protein
MIAGIIVPGRAYGPQAPLLDLAAEALGDRDAAVETVTWTVPEGLLPAATEPFVRAHVLTALHRVGERAAGTQPVIIAKSLGSYAAVLAAERELPAIWLTPLLHVDEITEAITRNRAPALLVGGTGDESWAPDAAARTGKTVLTIAGAGHGLRPPGPLLAYTAALGRVGTAIEEFLSQLA